MEYFAVLPKWKYSEKQIEIMDANNVKVGFIQRKYKRFWNKMIHYSPLTFSFLETIHLNGENNGNELKIREQSFKSNLTKLKWDIFLNDAIMESRFLLEDKTKISANPRMVYHKNNNEYLFKKDLLNRSCEVILNDEVYAKITMEKQVNIHIVAKTNDLTITELLGIYYVLRLTY